MFKLICLLPFLNFFLEIKGQPSLFGEYVEASNINDSFLIGEKLTLSCNKDFILEFRDVKCFGKWDISDGQTVVLRIDSSVSKNNSSQKKGNVKLLLKGDQLYETIKVESKRKYNRQNRKLNKMFQHSGIWEDYESYKSRIQNRYLKRNIVYSCA